MLSTRNKELLSKWNWVKLEEITGKNQYAFSSGPFGSNLTSKDYRDNGVPVLRGLNVSSGRLNLNDLKFISEQKAQELARSEVKPDDIVVVAVGASGLACRIPEILPRAIMSQNFNKVTPDPSKVHPVYLEHCLNDTIVQSQLQIEITDTVRTFLSLTKLKEVEIPLPPIEEQKRIATIAQKADRLRRTRRYTLELSDSYIRSVFLEMFGDPSTNPKNWKTIQLGEKISFLTSGSRGYAKYYSQTGEIFLRVENVGRSRLLLNELVFVNPPDDAESRRISVKSNDLLISMTADLGRSAIIPENFPKAYINQHLGLIRLKELNPFFVSGYMSTPGGQEQFKTLDRGGVKSGLNFDDVRSYKIVVPPLPLQEKFAQIVHRFERLRIQQREAERQAEHLFQTILHRAFRGEL